jgi:methyltransferase OMS1, mitochondrial
MKENGQEPQFDATAARKSIEERIKRERRLPWMHMSHNTYLYICGAFGFVLACYAAFTYAQYARAVKEYDGMELEQNADVSSRWLDLSRDFDAEVELSEKVMFLERKRKRLCEEARGNVLEVSAGTGRNMGLYRFEHPGGKDVVGRRSGAKRIVFNDLSEPMLLQAEKKFEKLQNNTGQQLEGKFEFVVGDASDRRVIKRPSGGFDTIVQTMGICSETNPVLFLRRLGELARQPGEKSTGVDARIIEREAKGWLEEIDKSKDYGADELISEHDTYIKSVNGDLGGVILILEHGRSKWSTLNRILDNGAKMHADHYGCWWNKDINQIVKDSGLIVESCRRFNFGTTYEYVLRPGPRVVAPVSVQVKSVLAEAGMDEKSQTKKSRLLGWMSGT